MTANSKQLESVETQINSITKALCNESQKISLHDETLRAPTVTWSWGWSINVSWRSEYIGSRYRLKSHDEHAGSEKSTSQYVANLANQYAQQNNHYFINILGEKISHKELENFNTGDIDLGNTGTNYISCDHCSRCGGHGKESCTSCSGRGYNQCYSCHGSGTLREWRSNGQHSGYVNTHCYHCSGGRTRCYHCGASGQVTCGSCDGSGEHFHRFWISALACKKVSWEWLESEVFKWLPSFIKEKIDQGSTGAITPYLTKCEPLHRNEPLSGCAYSFSMKTIIPCGEYAAISKDSNTRIAIVGPKLEIYSAGGILNAFVTKIAEKLNSGTIQDQKPYLAIPAIDVILQCHDEKKSHFLLWDNYVYGSAKQALTTKYEMLVARINGDKRKDFFINFAKYNALILIAITLAILSINVLFPQFSWHGEIVKSILKNPDFLFHKTTELVRYKFFETWQSGLLTVFCSILVIGAVKEFHWRRIGDKTSALLAFIYFEIGLVYYLGFQYSLAELGRQHPVTSMAHLGSLNLASLLILWPEILATSSLISFVISKYKAWRSTAKVVAKLESRTLSKRLKLI